MIAPNTLHSPLPNSNPIPGAAPPRCALCSVVCPINNGFIHFRSGEPAGRMFRLCDGCLANCRRGLSEAAGFSAHWHKADAARVQRFLDMAGLFDAAHASSAADGYGRLVSFGQAAEARQRAEAGEQRTEDRGQDDAALTERDCALLLAACRLLEGLAPPEAIFQIVRKLGVFERPAERRPPQLDLAELMLLSPALYRLPDAQPSGSQSRTAGLGVLPAEVVVVGWKIGLIGEPVGRLALAALRSPTTP